LYTLNYNLNKPELIIKHNMKKLITSILTQRVILLDGGMGSLLISSGLGDEAPESWNLDKPELMSEFHKNYFDAGADAALSFTFGGSRIKLEGKGLANKIEEINKAAVRNARSVCPQHKYVAGDIGPTGKLLKPAGTYTEEEFTDTFHEQAEILHNEGVDFFIIETMYDKREALCALKAIKKVTADCPVFVSLTFNRGPKGFRTVMGDDIESSFRLFEDGGAAVVGANCTLGSKDFIDLAKEMRKCTELPIVAQANAGQPVIENGKSVYKQSPEDYAKDAAEIVSSGADIIGGCCGTTPKFIRKIYEKIF